MKKITLVGAGGKMGMRITAHLLLLDYDVSYYEVSDSGIARLKEKDIEVTPLDTSIPDADFVILAVPDRVLGNVSEQVIPKMKSGAIVFTLDPAAALAGKLFPREDIDYFISHPCHPSIFNWESDEEAQKDYFGGTLAKQAIVCTLLSGSDAAYSEGETLAKTIYAPVSMAYRITAEQMGLLEPALVETLASTCVTIIREGLDEVIKSGVPEEAAKAFLFGHLNIQMAVLFDQIPGAVFSDAAQKAIIRGKPILFKEDWKKVFNPENVQEQINDIIT